MIPGPKYEQNEMIAGFPILVVKNALTLLGITFTGKRDDVGHIAKELGCPRAQAQQVLDALERRGLVTRANKKAMTWQKTEAGHQLTLWRPPRKYTPIIDRESEPTCGMGYEGIRCGIRRTMSDGEDAYEEATIELVVHTQYDNDRLIELAVMQPDEPDDVDSGGYEAIVTHITPSDAKTLVASLQKAIEDAESEQERRRSKAKERRRAPRLTSTR